MTPTWKSNKKSVRFIEDAEGINSELLPRLEALQLHEENGIVLGPISELS